MHCNWKCIAVPDCSASFPFILELTLSYSDGFVMVRIEVILIFVYVQLDRVF